MTAANRRRLALFAGAAGIVAGVAGARRAYRRDIAAAYERVNPGKASAVETVAGTVQYSVETPVGTDGVPVLVAHGIVGGFDQALQIGTSLLDTDTRVVGVSRFGYLGSTLPADPSPSAQAAAYGAVLDETGIEDAVMIGTSAGGAPAIRFALDYPERTRCLVLLGSTAPSEQPISGPTGPPAALCRDPVFWAFVRLVPRALRRLFGVSERTYQAASPAERRRVDALLETLLPVAPRRPGIRNDAAVTNTAMVEQYDEYPLEALRVPTLVVHAEDDPLASFGDAKRLVGRIPNATMRTYETGGHLVFGHGTDVQEAVTAFVETPAEVETGG